MSKERSVRSRELRAKRKFKSVKKAHFKQTAIREPFLTRYTPEIVIGLILLLGIMFFTSYKPKKDESYVGEYQSILNSIPADQVKQLDSAFPEGYQLFIVSKEGLVPSLNHSLPKSFKVDWDWARVVQFDQLAEGGYISSQDKKKIVLKVSVEYKGEHKSDSTYCHIKFLRGKKGVHEYLVGSARVTFSIWEDYGEYVLAVMSVKQP